MNENKNIPTTIAEAVNRLLLEIPITTKKQIKGSNEDDLNSFHLGLGMGIRNEFGLWGKDSKLLEECKKLSGDSDLHVDTASSMIIKALWERLQKFPPPEILED